MWFLQVSDGLDWFDARQLDEDEATVARSRRPNEGSHRCRVVSRQMLPDGYVDTLLKEWPVGGETQG